MSACFHRSRCPKCVQGLLELVDYEAKSGLRVYVCSLPRCAARFQRAMGQLEPMPKKGALQ